MLFIVGAASNLVPYLAVQRSSKGRSRWATLRQGAGSLPSCNPPLALCCPAIPVLRKRSCRTPHLAAKELSAGPHKQHPLFSSALS